MRDALTAKRTIGILDNTVARNIHRCAAACPCQIPDIQRLHLIANLDAAHTFDTFIHIPIERKCFCPRTAQPLLQLCFKGKLKDTQIIRNLLQLTVAAAYTGRTFAVMLRQNQFYICAACHSGTRGIRIHHHAILYRVAAGCNHRALALNFHTADTAGGNFIDSLQVAKMRDFYIDRLRRLHNRRSCRHLRKLSINRYSYHSPVLPPLKLPKPK